MTRWLLLALPLLFATAAAAQNVVTGSVRHDDAPVSVPEGRTEGDAARAIGDRFALCIVQHHLQQVEKVLAASPGMGERYTSLPKLMDPDCFGGTGSSVRQLGDGGGSVEFNTNPVSFGGALYKALVQRKFARQPAAFGPTPPEMPVIDGGPYLKFADCVVRRDPAGSLNLILTTAGTPREQAAIGALQPQFTLCLGQGISLKFSRALLIAIVAEAYYRESAASTGAN